MLITIGVSVTPEDEQIRANECQAIMANKYVRAALDEIERAMLENIIMCPVEKTALQNEMVNILRAKRKFEEILASHIATGKMAEMKVGQEKSKSFFSSLMGR